MPKQDAGHALSDVELDTITVGKGGASEPTSPGAAFAMGFFGLIFFPIVGAGAAIAEIEKPGAAKRIFDNIFE